MVKRLMLTVWCVTVTASLASMGVERDTQPGPRLQPAGVPQDPSAVGYLNLQKRHPDAAEGAEEFNTAYSSDRALQRLAQVQSFLVSFRGLTKRVRGTLPASELAAIGNTEADMQTIGFHNIPLIVEGTVLKQEYQLRQVQYELAQMKRARGDISAQELDQAKSAYERATKRFQVFWDTKLPTD
jgi:hypothetical protein